MNSPADIDNDDADIEAEEQDDSAVDSDARFEGDTGTLPVPARRVLVRLLQGPSLDARRHEKLWNLLKRHELILRSRLHDLFLELVLDDQSRVAFTRQVTSEEVNIPILLRRQSLSFIESVLLLFLRQKLTYSDAQAERAVVDRIEMQEYLKAYERSDNVDMSRFGRQMDGAIEKAKKLGVLLRLPASEERYEVSASLRLLFPVEEIEALPSGSGRAVVSCRAWRGSFLTEGRTSASMRFAVYARIRSGFVCAFCAHACERQWADFATSRHLLRS